MITVYFDSESKQPKYDQLYRFIKQEIESGHVIMNEKLPSKRSLANHLHVSIITVETAYQLLMAEGYIRSIEKKGYYVDTPPFPVQPNYPKKVVKPIKDTPQSIDFDFRTNVLEPSLFPFTIWARLSRHVINPMSLSQLDSPQHPQGILKLREAISDYLYRYRGMSVQPEQIIVGSGSEQLYRILIDLMGRAVLYGTENPGYPKIKQLIEMANAMFVDIPLDHQGLSLEGLIESKADVLFLTPNHQFPTGIIMPVKRRIDLLNWAYSDSIRYIVEGDYDSELTEMGQPIPTMQMLDHQNKVIYINTFSKTIAPVLRIAYMVLPPSLLKRYRQSMAFGPCPVPLFEQMILMKFIEEGDFERHINRIRQVYNKRKECLIKALIDEQLVRKDQIFDSGSGLHLVIKMDPTIEEDILLKQALKFGVKIYGLKEFIHGQSSFSEVYLLLGFSGMTEGTIQEGIHRLKQAWDALK